MKDSSSEYFILAEKISEKFKKIHQVDAVCLGGSIAKGFTDKLSDIDLYIYSDEKIPLRLRQDIVNEFGVKHADLNLTFWDPGDEWFDYETGIEVDIIYWDKTWIQGQIDRVLIDQQASVGYSTCFWYTVLNSTVLFDRDEWFLKLQEKCRQPYPEKLRNTVIAKNHPVLKNVIPSYYGQIKKAIERNDIISINHRVSALLASYFDVLFAINRLPNPGEKKLLRFSLKNCQKRPKNLKRQIKNVLESIGSKNSHFLKDISDLLDDLDELLISEGIDPVKTLFLDKKRE
jgi:predicted nucleotidyltransferase